jgi:hypothetical protein
MALLNFSNDNPRNGGSYSLLAKVLGISALVGATILGATFAANIN